LTGRKCTGCIRKNDDPRELTAIAEIPGVEVFQSRALNCRRASPLFGAARYLGWRLPFPLLRGFPIFSIDAAVFARLARLRRELGFRAQIASGRSILLSSESALRDCRKFYPSLTNEVSVLRFAAQPAVGLLTANVPMSWRNTACRSDILICRTSSGGTRIVRS
jgi:hypothetical protein